MIVARLYDGAWPSGAAKGSCGIAGYQDWFPVESFGFGFEPPKPESEKKTSPGGKETQAGARTPPSAASSVKEPEKDFTSVRISKPVDSATSYLMQMACEDRKETVGTAKSKRMADVHVLGSMQVGAESYIVPWVMVHLEVVLVHGWSMDASGDERPSESVELWYERASMVYVFHDKKQGLFRSEQRGWDQKKHGPWRCPNGQTVFNDFVPEAKSPV